MGHPAFADFLELKIGQTSGEIKIWREQMGIPEILFQAFRAQNRGNTWGYSGSRMGQNRHVTKSIIGSINTETIVAIALKKAFHGGYSLADIMR